MDAALLLVEANGAGAALHHVWLHRRVAVVVGVGSWVPGGCRPVAWHQVGTGVGGHRGLGPLGSWRRDHLVGVGGGIVGRSGVVGR